MTEHQQYPWFEKRTFLRGVVGSTAHGLHTDDGVDDRDEMGICIEPMANMIGQSEFEQVIYRAAALLREELEAAMRDNASPGNLYAIARRAITHCKSLESSAVRAESAPVALAKDAVDQFVVFQLRNTIKDRHVPGVVEALEREWRQKRDALILAVYADHQEKAESAPVDQQMNAWREVGEEMQRVVSFMTPEQRADLLPDWFMPRLMELLK